MEYSQATTKPIGITVMSAYLNDLIAMVNTINAGLQQWGLIFEVIWWSLLTVLS